MKRAYHFFIVFSVLLSVLSIGCKTEFEKIRVSGDKDLLYKKAFEYYEAEEYTRAQTLFEILIPAFRGKKELEKIYFTYAYTYFKDGKYILGSYYFKNFTSTFPSSAFREEAEFMSAYSNYKLSPAYRLDQTYTEKAIDELQLFTNTFPESERVEQSNRLIDELRLKLEQKAFSEAELYFNLRQYQAATHTFENLLKDFPETKKGELIRFMLVKASFNLAKNSIVDRQPERYKTVEKYATKFIEKYPKSDFKTEVNLMYDLALKKLKSISK